MYDNLNFFVFTMKQIASIFCNVSFAGQYNKDIVYIYLLFTSNTPWYFLNFAYKNSSQNDSFAQLVGKPVY